LRGDQYDPRELDVALKTAREERAAAVEPKQLRQEPAPRDDKIEVVLVDPQGRERPLPDSSGGSSSAPPVGGSYPPSGSGGGYWHHSPSDDELRLLEQRAELDRQLAELRANQDRVQTELRKRSDAPRPGDRGPHGWLKH
jgi:hypothetical protein